MQPAALQVHAEWGWEHHPSGVVKLGRKVSPQFVLGPDVSRHHCLLGYVDTSSDLIEDGRAFEIENYGRYGTTVLIHPDDMVEGIETFDPAELWPESLRP
jgi:hypothetical protein